MKYAKPLTVTAMTLLSVLLVGCVRTNIANGVPRCETMIPQSWKAGVPSADLPVTEALPDGHDNAKPWQEGYIAQTGQLEKANYRTADTDYIYTNCLTNAREAQAQAKQGFFTRLFSGVF